MSDVNKKLSLILDFDLIVRRLMDSYGFSQVSELHELFQISRQNFANKKKAGTILPTIIYFALQKNIDLNWLLTGNAHDPQLLDIISDINERLSNLEASQHSDQPQALKKGAISQE